EANTRWVFASRSVQGANTRWVFASRSVQGANTRWVFASRSVQGANTRWVFASRSVQGANTRWVLAFFRKGINQCANGHSGLICYRHIIPMGFSVAHPKFENLMKSHRDAISVANNPNHDGRESHRDGMFTAA
ncbi:MAG: hypothetical protein LBL57_03250, partial [Tannerella sp.]|nr:hypothetical protein [Tannerella sp.]